MKEIGIDNGKQIDEEMNILWDRLKKIRAYFPYVGKNCKGVTAFTTAPYYGKDIHSLLKEPLTNEDITEMQEKGHWINQNFVIRLYALMESYELCGGKDKAHIDTKLDGGHLFDIVKQLRNVFAHESGRYDPKNSEHLKILESMKEHLGILIDGLIAWPLAIDTVLEKLLKGCRKYAKEKLKIT